MVLTSENINYILGLITLGGVIFAIYNYFKKPQENTDNKASLLAQGVQLQNEQNERRFKEVTEAGTVATTLAQNHIHSVDVKVDQLITVVNDMRVNFTSDITKLATIINERIPKK